MKSQSAEYMEQFLIERRKYALSERTVVLYRTTINSIERCIGKPIFEFSGEDVLEYFRCQERRRLTPNTLIFRLAIFNGVYKWGVRRGVLDHNVVHDVIDDIQRIICMAEYRMNS